MGAAYVCDICDGVFRGRIAMRVQADVLIEDLDAPAGTIYKILCPSCTNKVLKALSGDFGYVPPRDRIIKEKEG